jgi:arginine/ornithine N-succinyltransferase beta subunit
MKFNDNYIPDLAQSDPVVRACTDAADRIADAARSSAPVLTGKYKAGIVVRVRRSRFRTVVSVVSSDPKTMIIESKTGNLVKALRTASRRG